MPDDRDVPPDIYEEIPVTKDTAPAGFWVDLVSEIRKELKPPAVGFFATTPNAPIEGFLRDSRLELVCAASFIVDVINKPDILEVVSRKASAKLGKPIRVVAVDKNKVKVNSQSMEKLIQFGRDHSDIITIK